MAVKIKRYRSPEDIQSQIKQEKDPQPISMVGGGRGGALIAFAEAQKTAGGYGR